MFAIYLSTDPTAERIRKPRGTQRTLASASFIGVCIGETDRPTWFVFEAGRPGNATGH